MCDKPASNKLTAIIQHKCPRCRSGKMFTHSFYNLRKFMQMPAECPVCGLNLEPEPGFYWAAMYVSYGLSVGIILTEGILLYMIFGDPDLYILLSVILGTIILGSTILFRLSRVLIAHFLPQFAFDPKYQKKDAQK